MAWNSIPYRDDLAMNIVLKSRVTRTTLQDKGI